MLKQCVKTLFCLSLSAYCAEPLFAANIIDVYTDALNYDATVLEARERLNQRGELIPQAYAVLLPNSDLYADATIMQVKGSTYQGTQDRDAHNVRVSLTQALLNLAAWFNVNAQRATVAQAQADYLSVAQHLITRVTKAYLDVLAAEDNLRFTQAEVKAFSRQLEQARERHKVGIDPITNVYEAEARFDSAKAREIAAANAIQNRFEDLRVITGIRYATLDKIRDELPLLKPMPNRIDEWETATLMHNFRIKASQFAVDAAHHDIKRAYADHFPVVNAFAEYDNTYLSKAGPGTFKTDDQSYLLGLRLNFNIYSGGAITSRTREARYNWLAEQQNLEAARRESVNQARQSYHNVVSLISQIKAARQAIVSNTSALRSTEEAFKVGTRTILDVLDAQQLLTRAEQEHAFSQYDYLNSRINLKEAAGILTVKDLEEINAWLVPTKNNRIAVADTSMQPHMPESK